jgi:hypothetical protein
MLRIRHLDLGANKLAGGARHPPTSHLAFLFVTLITLASGVVFTVAGVVVVAFQLTGVFAVAAMLTGASVTGSVFLVVYEVVRMGREADEGEDLPNTMFPSPLRRCLWPRYTLAPPGC